MMKWVMLQDVLRSAFLSQHEESMRKMLLHSGEKDTMPHFFKLRKPWDRCLYRRENEKRQHVMFRLIASWRR